MTTPQAFRDLAAIIEGFDAAEISVDGVRTNGEGSAGENSLTAELTARIPWNATAELDGAVSFALPDGTDVGRTDRELTVPLRVEVADDGGETAGAGTDESADAAKLHVTDGGVRAPVKTDDAATERAAENSDEDAPSDRSADADEPATPPHRDPAKLREVYEAHETFAEMTEALGASVTPQTVRNQMIRRGIHEPNRQRGSSAGDEADAAERGRPNRESERESNEETPERGDSGDDRSATEVAQSERSGDDPEREEQTEREERADQEAAAASDEEPTLVDLPSHVSLDDVGAAVTEATTLYEVQRALRTDRTTTRKLLQQLDLLELVTGRVATADDRKGAVDEIDERIRRART